MVPDLKGIVCMVDRLAELLARYTPNLIIVRRDFHPLWNYFILNPRIA